MQKQKYAKLKGVVENLAQILESAKAIDLHQAELNLRAMPTIQMP